jgi:hypothetical protein
MPVAFAMVRRTAKIFSALEDPQRSSNEDAMNRMFASAGLLAAVALISLAAPAHANRYDGNWTMIAQTTRGHCGVIQVGLGIQRGRIFATSGSFAFYPISIGGRVSSGGSATLKAITGPRTAYGTGRFKGAAAQGTWRGKGPSGLCSGVWSAKRY